MRFLRGRLEVNNAALLVATVLEYEKSNSMKPLEFPPFRGFEG